MDNKKSRCVFNFIMHCNWILSFLVFYLIFNGEKTPSYIKADNQICRVINSNPSNPLDFNYANFTDGLTNTVTLFSPAITENKKRKGLLN